MKNNDVSTDRVPVLQSYSFDLLKLRPIRAFAKSRYVPLVFQVGIFMLFAYAIYACFVGLNSRGNNFGILMFWSVFWPSFIMISLVTVGKMWCGVCPLGAINNAVQRFGLRKAFPVKLRSGIIALILWVVVVWMVREIFEISSDGPATGWFFLAFTAAAVGVGIIYRNRSWCKYLCPIGIASGLWSMLALFELRPTLDKCQNCRTYECVKGNGQTPGCPMGLHPGRLDSNRDCVYCLNCVKVCPHDSPQIRLRKPWKELVTGTRRLMVDAGYALWIPVVLALKENMEHYYTPGFLVSGTTWLQNLLGTTNRFGVWFFLVVLFNAVLLVGAYMLATSWASKKLNWEYRKTFSTFAYMFIPIVIVTIGGHALMYFFENIWGQMVSVILAPLGIYGYANPSPFNAPANALIGDSLGTPVLYAVGFFGTVALPYMIAAHREADHRKALQASIFYTAIAAAVAGYFLWSHVYYSGGTWRW